ncbi:MAG: hypothetical protein GWM92_18580 [Gemmatimonadetes bacterium]|nr:hypothetical protein [Gemmatimonadota bacterium]NIR80805.1 hypothetical protein [Gemmatimonadota bacterium]NIT89625.1 hypothetical protein [Gemmatimonadota bacterium]NIU34231.1 hypothetical protein [Gemmatimonadota bacterium]NIU37697.1 hypothetical protein [Gemmatimonadota bacterium]
MRRRGARRLPPATLASILPVALGALVAVPCHRPTAAQQAGARATSAPRAAVPVPSDAGPRRTVWPDAAPSRGSTTSVLGRRPRQGRSGPVQIGVSPRSPAVLALGGLLGGAAGFFAGGYLGAWIADETADPGQDLAAVGGFALGGAAGEVLGLALGVHRADRGEGSFWSDLFASALSGAAIVGSAALIDLDGAPAWTLAGLGVAVQIGFTVGTEIRSRP